MLPQRTLMFCQQELRFLWQMLHSYKYTLQKTASFLWEEITVPSDLYITSSF